MSIVNVSGPTPGTCAGLPWKVNFVLPTPSVAGGYFVQDVAIYVGTTDCAGAARPAQSISSHYWEAWHVDPGGTRQDLVANGTYDYTDMYSNASPGAGTKGTFSITGSVAFYEGLTLPATFVPNNPATFAGHLPSTTTNPALRGGTPVLAHNINGTWNCCPAAMPTVISGHTP
jgi:hypothetical protein